jgi:hypothetical protein
VREVLLGGQHPQVDAGGYFTPTIMPRSVALSPGDQKVYATGQ